MRTTHHRRWDHHEFDVPSNMVLEFDMGIYSAGMTIEDVLLSLVSRIAALEMSGNIYGFEARAVFLREKSSSFKADAVLE
jgi:hypothetical protein